MQGFGKIEVKIRAAALICYNSFFVLTSPSAPALPALGGEQLYRQWGDAGKETGRVANRVARHASASGGRIRLLGTERHGRASHTQDEERHKTKFPDSQVSNFVGCSVAFGTTDSV